MAIESQKITPAPLSGVPVHYMNGFSLSIGAADVNLQVLQDGVPVAVIKASFTTAKTLLENLSTLFSRFEAQSGRPIMNMEEANKALEKINSAPKV